MNQNPNSISLKLFCILIFLPGFIVAQKQNVLYKPVPSAYLPTNQTLDSLRLESGMHMAKAFDLSLSLPKGFVKDGTVNYRKYVQEALKEHKIVVFPDFPILIDGKGLEVSSNSILLFQKKSALYIMSNSYKSYSGLLISDVENVSIYFPKIIGERKTHKGNEGNRGMGIRIMGAKNIRLYNPVIKDCWGDGIYIANSSISSQVSEKIAIYYPVLDYNRRNGMSIISGRNIFVKNLIVANTLGVMPMSGIDIEPNDETASLDSIVISNPITFNNGNSGIQISPAKMVGKKEKRVEILIENHTDYDSRIGLRLGGFHWRYLRHTAVKGNIIIDAPKWVNNQLPLEVGRNYNNGAAVRLIDIEILSSNSRGIFHPRFDYIQMLDEKLSSLSNLEHSFRN